MHRFKKRPSGLFFYALLHKAALQMATAPRLQALAGTALFLASLIPSLATAQARLLPTTTLTVGDAIAHVEVAATAAARNRGLMFREHLAPDHGMLFVFEDDTSTCFWMKNTPLPLTIAFIDTQGVIINLRDMQPHSEASHCPARPMRYALEMRQGWFLGYGISAGQQVKGLPQR